MPRSEPSFGIDHNGVRYAGGVRPRQASEFRKRDVKQDERKDQYHRCNNKSHPGHGLLAWI
jgi:hypothetical protein